MRRRAIRNAWAIALAGSFGIHGVVAASLAVLPAPQPRRAVDTVVDVQIAPEGVSEAVAARSQPAMPAAIEPLAATGGGEAGEAARPPPPDGTPLAPAETAALMLPGTGPGEIAPQGTEPPAPAAAPAPEGQALDGVAPDRAAQAVSEDGAAVATVDDPALPDAPPPALPAAVADAALEAPAAQPVLQDLPAVPSQASAAPVATEVVALAAKAEPGEAVQAAPSPELSATRADAPVAVAARAASQPQQMAALAPLAGGAPSGPVAIHAPQVEAAANAFPEAAAVASPPSALQPSTPDVVAVAASPVDAPRQAPAAAASSPVLPLVLADGGDAPVAVEAGAPAPVAAAEPVAALAPAAAAVLPEAAPAPAAAASPEIAATAVASAPVVPAYPGAAGIGIAAPVDAGTVVQVPSSPPSAVAAPAAAVAAEQAPMAVAPVEGQVAAVAAGETVSAIAVGEAPAPSPATSDAAVAVQPAAPPTVAARSAEVAGPARGGIAMFGGEAAVARVVAAPGPALAPAAATAVPVQPHAPVADAPALPGDPAVPRDVAILVPMQPLFPELPAEEIDPRERIIAHLSTYQGGDCFLAMPSAGNGAVAVQGFGVRPGELSRLGEELAQATGVAVDTSVQAVTSDQCGALSFARALSPRSVPEIGIRPDVEAVASGTVLSGRIEKPARRFVNLLLVDATGTVQRFRHLSEDEDGSIGFSAPMTLMGEAVRTPQLLVAVAADAELETPLLHDGLHADRYFAALAEEVERTGNTVEFGLAYFFVH